MSDVIKNTPYTIEIKLTITNKVREYPYNGEIACTELKKTVTCPAANVREEATKVLRQAVANFSESAVQGLAPIIESEPKIEEAARPDALEV